jgi:DNA-directed RNA polymerase specialized sigma24 family protein
MRHWLTAVRKGEIGFNTFALETRGDWERLSQVLVNRWVVPSTVTLEDLVQEMLIEVWLQLPNWNPERGTPIEKFVVFTACVAAKRWIHRQRKAKRLDGSAHSRSAITFAELDRRQDGAVRQIPDEREPDLIAELTAQRRAVEIIAELEPADREIALLLFETGGDVRAAAARVMRSGDLRLACRIDSVSTACRVVRCVLKQLEERHGNSAGEDERAGDRLLVQEAEGRRQQGGGVAGQGGAALRAAG